MCINMYIYIYIHMLYYIHVLCRFFHHRNILIFLHASCLMIQTHQQHSEFGSVTLSNLDDATALSFATLSHGCGFGDDST